MPNDDPLDHEIDRDLGWDEGHTARIRRAAREPILGRLTRTWPGRIFIGACRGLFKLFFFPVFSAAGFTRGTDANGRPVTIKQAPLRRLVDGLMVRILLTPVVVALFFIVLVWQTTHPQPASASQTPAALGMFFQRITVQCSDGQEVQAWHIPPLSADDVLLQRDAVIGRRYPAVVLVHGLGLSHDQYLGLAQQFHQAGCTVLMLDTRGQGESPAATVTFGIRERFDIIAALNYCRALPETDEGKLAIVGCGAEGAAALQVAAVDPTIGVVVADAVRPSFSDNLQDAMRNRWVPARYLTVPYAATFELLMREHLSALNLTPVVGGIHHAAILFIARPESPADPSLVQIASLASTAGVAHRIVTCAQRPFGAGKLLPQEAASVVQFTCENLNWDPQETTPVVHGLLDSQVK